MKRRQIQLHSCRVDVSANPIKNIQMELQPLDVVRPVYKGLSHDAKHLSDDWHNVGNSLRLAFTVIKNEQK